MQAERASAFELANARPRLSPLKNEIGLVLALLAVGIAQSAGSGEAQLPAIYFGRLADRLCLPGFSQPFEITATQLINLA
jgi:hypothetical protein